MAFTTNVVTLDELAHHLELSKRWLRREAVEHRIPSLLAGQRRLFNVEAVRKALAERAAEPRSQGGAQ